MSSMGLSYRLRAGAKATCTFDRVLVISCAVKILVGFGLSILLFSVAGDRGVTAILRTHDRARALSAEIAAIRAENAKLRVEAEALRRDPSAIEREARQTLGLARADEIVVTRRR